MSSRIASMATPAGVVAQFQAMRVILDSMSDRVVTVENALDSFCHRISSGPTLEALSKVTEFPKGLASIMIRCLEHLHSQEFHDSKKAAIDNLTRQLKAMEIETRYGNTVSRRFIWSDGGSLAAAANLPFQYEGRVTVKRATVIAPKGDSLLKVDHLEVYTYKMKDTKLEVFYWQIISKNETRVAKGHANSLMEAVESLQIAYYRILTKQKLHDASLPGTSARLIVMGNWITNEEFLTSKGNLQVVVDANSDEREDTRMFVIGWPTLHKEKAEVLVWKVDRASRFGEISAQNCVIRLRSGFELDASHDWYIYKPERNVVGEVACMKCTTPGTITSLGMLCVRGHGLLCGPCIDHLTENDAITDDQFD